MGASRGDIGRVAGPLLIALVGCVMLSWSWGTWPDPLVDFGAQLYAPWQICAGKILYRDVAYYSGPFSCYFNALMFGVFGVGLRTLVWVNLVIVVLTLIVAYRLTMRCSGRLAATIGGITFVLVFAFGQVVGVGNFNWVTPYTHEVCHGTAMGIAAIALLRRYQVDGKKSWLIGTGFLLGLVSLTKAEPTVASFAAVCALLTGGWWIERADGKKILTMLVILIGSAIIAPLIATLCLSRVMPWRQAVRFEIGSWAWTFDRRIASLHFYRAVAGLDDVAGNLSILLRWVGVWVVVVLLGLTAAFVSRSKSWVIGTVLSVLIVGWGVIRFDSVNWSGMLTPLPICLLIISACSLPGVFRRTNPAAPLQVCLVVFALALVSKMGLSAKPFHYGFVLAWPGTVVVICAMVRHLPRWIEKKGGNGRTIVATGAAVWLTCVVVLLMRDAGNFSSKKMLIAGGTADAFYGNARALEVAAVCARVREIVPPDSSVEVLPQGLMVNYLTRRESPTRFTNFMPPEVIAVGENAIVAALNRNSPAAVVLTTSSIEGNCFTMDGKDAYGADTLAWVKSKYRFLENVELPFPMRAAYGFEIWVRR